MSSKYFQIYLYAQPLPLIPSVRPSEGHTCRWFHINSPFMVGFFLNIFQVVTALLGFPTNKNFSNKAEQTSSLFCSKCFRLFNELSKLCSLYILLFFGEQISPIKNDICSMNFLKAHFDFFVHKQNDKLREVCLPRNSVLKVTFWLVCWIKTRSFWSFFASQSNGVHIFNCLLVKKNTKCVKFVSLSK